MIVEFAGAVQACDALADDHCEVWTSDDRDHLSVSWQNRSAPRCVTKQTGLEWPRQELAVSLRELDRPRAFGGRPAPESAYSSQP
jgi:hypothetical protein